MDRRPTLETRPPVLIDAVVRALIPPACREHVIGDLWERYRSPWQFVLDAAGTIPFVLASQIRRTSTLASVVIHTFLLFVSLGVGTGRPSGKIVAPLAGALLAFVLRDAYKRGLSISAKQVGADALFGACGLLTSQALLALTLPHQLLPISAYSVLLAAFGVIFLVRLQNPNLAGVSRKAMAQVPATLDALVTEVRLFERMTRRAVRIEAVTGMVIAAFFIMPLISAPNWALRIGWALASAYGLYVAAVVTKLRTESMPDGLEFKDALEHYRSELVRQHHHIRTLWRWYILPMAPGMTFIIVGSAIEASKLGRPLWPAFMMAAILAGLGAVIHLSTNGTARKLQVRIDALGSVRS
jgi:hypothetical protein